MWRLGFPELIIVLVIVLLLFGVGRLSKIGRELGEGIREFRRGLLGEDSSGKERAEGQKEAGRLGL